jgi:hypothetical protein
MTLNNVAIFYRCEDIICLPQDDWERDVVTGLDDEFVVVEGKTCGILTPGG